MCSESVVFPDDSGPKISIMRPRGTPPMPSAQSRPIEPVGIASIPTFAVLPSVIIDSSPNFVLIEAIASWIVARVSIFLFSPESSLAAFFAFGFIGGCCAGCSA